MAVEKNGDKERTKLLSCLHVSSLFKTFLPLAIVLQKTTCNTCSFECGIQHSLKHPKIFPRFRTFDNDQQQPGMKAFSCRWVNKVHPSNDISSTVWLLLSGLFLSNKAMGVEIGMLLCCRDCVICSKPLSKVTLFSGIMVHNLHQIIIIIIEIDGLLIWKVNGQMIDRGLLFMHGEFCNMPKSLQWTNLMGPNISSICSPTSTVA